MIPTSEPSNSMVEHLTTFSGHQPSERSATVGFPPSSSHNPYDTGKKSQTLPQGSLAAPAASFGDGFQDDDDDEQEHYVDPSELRDQPPEEVEYYNQETIDKLRLSAPDQEEYETPRELGYSSQVHPEDDHSTFQHPPVPPRGVMCAPSDHPSGDNPQDESKERHDTLDNEYVVMKPQIDKMLDEQAAAAHSYVNIAERDGRPGRSVTLPNIDNPRQPSTDEDDEEQPTYYNIHLQKQPGEEMYTSIS